MASSTGTPSGRTSRSPLATAARIVSVALQAGLLWIVATSGLVAPPWAVLLGLALWTGASVVLVRALRRRPLAAPAVPLALLVVWIAIITLGDLLLGWTA